jgi:outer membrane protein OmpA-like peptidoglycan-associated protein/opacity protein-like surface antigen
MKKYALAALTLAAVLMAPGVSQAYPKQGWYAGLGAGVGFQESTDATAAATTDNVKFNPGFVVSGSTGFGFENQLRPEFEVAYRKSTVDSVTGPGAGGGSGNINSIAFMGNLFYDFDTRSGLTPYLGVGIGGAFVGADGIGSVFTGDAIEGSPFQLAYQGIAGFSYELSERVEATLDYRYFRTTQPEFKTVSNLTVSDMDYVNHTVMLGLRYIFGIDKPLPAPVAMREAPRPVMVMPAAPAPMQPYPAPQMGQMAPMPPAPAVPETYIVFFDFDKYYLTPEAKETLQRAADAFRAGGNAHVQVTGHTDTSGSNRYNKRLSERRGRVVKEYMVALGIPGGEISTRGAGEGELMVPTGNNVREAKNRRAEIILQ